MAAATAKRLPDSTAGWAAGGEARLAVLRRLGEARPGEAVLLPGRPRRCCCRGPQVRVRDNLWGLLGRSVYYQLIDWGHEVVGDNGETHLSITSMGQEYRLGSLAD